MLNTRILNPLILSLLARVRHTNSLVIADGRFPFWPEIETVDISLANDIPSVLQVLAALRPDFQAVQAYMAREFLKTNPSKISEAFKTGLAGIPIAHEPHVQFKKRVPGAIGLIRTGDTLPYANLILVSG
jgi:D-ribose pyranase